MAPKEKLTPISELIRLHSSSNDYDPNAPTIYIKEIVEEGEDRVPNIHYEKVRCQPLFTTAALEKVEGVFHCPFKAYRVHGKSNKPWSQACLTTQCQYIGKSNCDMVRHQQGVHTDYKPFRCKHCKGRHTQAAHVKTCEKTQKGLKWPCDCGKKLGTQATLSRHQKKCSMSTKKPTERNQQPSAAAVKKIPASKSKTIGKKMKRSQQSLAASVQGSPTPVPAQLPLPAFSTLSPFQLPTPLPSPTRPLEDDFEQAERKDSPFSQNNIDPALYNHESGSDKSTPSSSFETDPLQGSNFTANHGNSNSYTFADPALFNNSNGFDYSQINLFDNTSSLYADNNTLKAPFAQLNFGQLEPAVNAELQFDNDSSYGTEAESHQQDSDIYSPLHAAPNSAWDYNDFENVEAFPWPPLSYPTFPTD
ncbi:hypothetical protein EJ08DRAFT_664565 [Tothia fuscella]|uniref:C2H2-type domain-containing protein n=1 Tax=Tothia fuscella TaxID=1048955 RepID=A0A9P4NJ07_9PEZI|nr:hypothetical protein EJ08DRAFT_664565 [Tothia fuscella]